MRGMINLCKVDYFRSLAVDDPTKMRLKDKIEKLVDPSPEKRVEFLSMAKAVDWLLVCATGMPTMTAYDTVIKICCESSSFSCNPDFDDRLGFLEKLRARKDECKGGAKKRDLKTFDKLFDFLITCCTPDFYDSW